MRKTTLFAIATCALLALTLAPPAEASHRANFFIGGGFNVGGVYFNIAFGTHDQYGPQYYYRTRQDLHYRGARCTSRCFKQDRYYYHSPKCGLALTHLDHYGHDAYNVFERYAPRHERYSHQYPNPYYRYDYRNDYQRRPRYDDYAYRDDGRRYDGRGRGHRDHRGYQDRGRGRGRGRGHNGHGRSCPYDHHH